MSDVDTDSMCQSMQNICEMHSVRLRVNFLSECVDCELSADTCAHCRQSTSSDEDLFCDMIIGFFSETSGGT